MKRVAVVSLLFALIAAPMAQAIEQSGVGGRPAYPRAEVPRSQSIFIHTAEAGKVIKEGIEVVNNTEEKKTILVYAVDSQVASGGSFACAQQADTPKSVGTWIRLAKPSVTLTPHTKEVVPFTVTIPNSTGPGEYNGCIAIQDTTQVPVKGRGGVVISLRSAVRVAITVPGDLQRELQITDLNLQEKTGNKLLMHTKLHNSGNVSVDTDIDMRLKYLFGGVVKEESGSFPILAGTDSEYNFEVDKPFWGGFYQLEVGAAYTTDDASKESKHLNSTKYVFVSPHPMAILLILLGIVVLGVGIGYWLMWTRNVRHWDLHGRVYTVKDGDDLESIAEHFGVSWRRLAKVNKIKAPYKVRPGQRLTVLDNTAQRARK